MSKHDPLCSINLPQGVCRCAWLAEVRADEREQLRTKVEALRHAPACPGDVGCWCPIHQVLGMLNRGSDEDAR